MARVQKNRNLIWALDPLATLREKTVHLEANAAKTLQLLSKGFSCNIEPVYIMDAASQYSIEFDLEWIPKFTESVQTTAENIFKKHRHIRLLPLKILTQEGTSTYGAVETLSHYAANQKAFLIVSNSHSRKGVKRFFLGSFAETLLLKSNIPVVIVGPHIKKIRPFKKILFPTDFNPDAHLIFKRILEISQLFKAKVTVFHVIPFSIQPYTSGNILFPGSYWGAYIAYVKTAKSAAKKHGDVWQALAKKHGIQVETFVDDRGSRSTWESILNYAKKHDINMIAMESLSGPVSSTVIGSITRQVVRHAECPVWTIHPKHPNALRST